MADEKGNLPSGIPASAGSSPVAIANTTTDMDKFCVAILSEYMPALPTDPSLDTGDVESGDCSGTRDTGYKIEHTAADRIKVSAPLAEVLDPGDPAMDISVTR